MIATITTLVQEFVPQRPEEERCKRSMLSLVETMDCLSSQHFSPGHFTASALVLSPNQKAVALIFHPAFQKWIQPGGHIDVDDSSIQQTALREVQEETSLSSVQIPSWAPAILDVEIHHVPENSKKRQPAHQHFDIRFVFQSLDWNIQPKNEIKKVQWVLLDDIETIESDGSVRLGVQRLKKLLELDSNKNI